LSPVILAFIVLCVGLTIIFAIILDIIIGIPQFLFGLITFVFFVLISPFVATIGLSPIIISLLHMCRGFTRATIILGIINFYFFDCNEFLKSTSPTTYRVRTCKDYYDFICCTIKELCNLFSLEGFLTMNSTPVDLMLSIPIVNCVMGSILLTVGIITLPFTFIVTLIIRTKSVSWFEWSLLQIMRGLIGMSIFGGCIYEPVYHSHLKMIYRRAINYNLKTEGIDTSNRSCYCLITNYITSDIIDEVTAEQIMSYDWTFRNGDDYRELCRTLKRELNPYSLEFLFVENGKLNLMDIFGMIPILGCIPGFLLLSGGIFGGCCYAVGKTSLSVYEANEMTPCRKFNFRCMYGLFAMLGPMALLNIVVYSFRLDLVPLRQRTKVNTPTTHNITHNTTHSTEIHV
jgi:hypothetical protein